MQLIISISKMMQLACLLIFLFSHCHCAEEGQPPSLIFGSRKLTGHVFDFPDKQLVDKSYSVPWLYMLEASLKSSSEKYMDKEFQLVFNYTIVCENKERIFGLKTKTTHGNILSVEDADKVYIIACKNATNNTTRGEFIQSDMPILDTKGSTTPRPGNTTNSYSFIDGQIHVNLVSGVLGKTFVEFVMEEYHNKTIVVEENRIEVVRYPVSIVQEFWSVEIVFTVIIYCTQVIEMFSLGIRVDTDLVREHIWNPVAPIIVLCCQFVVMPLVSFAVAKSINIDNKLIALGVFISGCCPGSEATNTYTYILKGNLSLSVTMSVISNIVAIGMLPLWVLTLGYTFTDEAELVVPFPMIAISLSILITPVVIGIFLRQRHPAIALGISRWILFKPAILSMSLLVIVLSTWANIYILRLMEPRTVIAACLLPYGLSILSGVIALVFKQPWRTVKTIAVETSMQNVMIAYVIMTSVFTSPDGDIGAVAPVAVVVLTPIPIFLVSVVYVTWHQLRKKYKSVYQTEEPADKSKPVDSELNGNTRI